MGFESPEHALVPGAVVDNLRIESVLGIGGFGITYKAHDEHLQRPVAVKEYFPSGLATRAADDTTLSPRTRGDSDFYEYGLSRFLDEARTLAKFQHPNIVRVNRFVEANGTAYLVMDFEEGSPLDDVIDRVGQITGQQALALGVHLLRGLRAMHDKRYLHRDIKPANVFVRRKGPPVLLDFGAARQALEQRSAGMTVMLTPGYAPIEQYDSTHPQGPYTDIYALGATLFHALTGGTPPPSTRRALAGHVDGEDPVTLALTKMRSHLQPSLLQALIWMLQTAPEDRPQSASALLDFLLPGRDTGERSSASLGAALGSTKTPPQVPAHRPDWTAPGAPSAEHDSSAAHAGQPLRVSPELIAVAQEQLAEFLGPIASVLVRRAAESANSPKDLIDTLAGELEDDSERQAFQSAVKRHVS